MVREDNEYFYNDTMRELLQRATDRKEVAYLLPVLTSALGAMGSVIEEADLREMYLHDVDAAVRRSCEEFRPNRSAEDDK